MKRLAWAIALVIILALPILVGKELVAVQAMNAKVDSLLRAGEYVPGQLLVRYRQPAFQPFAIGNTDSDGKGVGFEILVVEPESIDDQLRELLSNPDVEAAQPNYIYKTTVWDETTTTATPDDYNPSNHWYYSNQDLPEAWKHLDCPDGPGCGGSPDVTVAVIDTGLAAFDFDDTGGQTGAVFVANSEYANINLYTNPDEIPDNQLDDDCNGVVDDYNGLDSYAFLLTGSNTCIGGVPQVVDESYYKAGIPVDTFGHGTYVTGLISSAVDNGASSVSPAFNVTIMPIAASFHFQNSFASSALITALSYAEAYGADVVNMSLGGPSADPFMNSAVQDLVDAGVVVVASSGNTGLQEQMYPSAFANVVAVGSINNDQARSNYSTYGSHIDLVAYVGAGASAGNATWQSSLSCFGSCDANNVDNGYSNRYGIGTSYAAPQVSALAALLLSYDSTLTNEDVVTLMIESAIDVGAIGRDNQTGHGAINFDRALDLVDFYSTEQPQTDLVYRFYNVQSGAHFYTNRETDRDKVLSSFPQYQYEGVAYQVFDQQISGVELTPVYQFYNPKTLAHFYTASMQQRNKVINNFPDFQYEGPRFFVYTENKVKSKPIYRFYNVETGAHFYTASEQQRQKVINTYPQFDYEGIAYYVPDYGSITTP